MDSFPYIEDFNTVLHILITFVLLAIWRNIRKIRNIIFTQIEDKALDIHK